MTFPSTGIRGMVLLLCGIVLARAVLRVRLWSEGPGKDHGRYQESVRLVDEEQLLRNLVHLRYSEVPLDLNVSSIAAQYELNGTAEARPFFLAPNPCRAMSSSGHSRPFCPTSP